MIRKYLSMLLLLLASLSLLAACGEDDDSNDSRPDLSTSGADTSGSTSGVTTGDTSGVVEDTDGTTSGVTTGDTSGVVEDTSGTLDTSGGTSGSTSGTVEDTSDVTSDDTSGGDTSGSTCTTGCCPNTVFSGQIFQDVAPRPDSTNGGTVRTTPYDASYDAGLAAIRAAIPAGSTSATTINLNVTEATVTAVGFKPAAATGYQSFWLADGQASIQVFLGGVNARDNAPTELRVGHKVSFTATEGNLFRGIPQITNITGASWVRNSEDNPVYVKDIDPTVADIAVGDIQSIIRVTGTLVGTPEACPDPSLCYDLDYGGTSTVVLRVRNNFLGGSLAAGDCMTFAGPVGVFDDLPQLDASQFDWLWRNNQQ